MRIGIATTDFAAFGADVLFGKIAGMGFESAQFAFASVIETDFVPDGRIEIPPVITAAAVNAIGKAASRYNISIVSCNGTYNMSHPSAEVRAEGIKRMDGFAAAVRELGASIISLCSGTRNEGYLWSYHADSQTPAAWADMIESMKRAAEVAERYGLVLAVETEYSNVVDTPEKARRMMDEVGSPRLKMVMDCANLFHPGDARADNAAAVITHAFDVFGGDIVLAHGKDIRASDGIEFCPTGEGIVDFKLFIQLLAKYGYTGDMVLHGILDEAKMPRGIEAVVAALG